MSKKEKLVARLLSKQKNFTFEELAAKQVAPGKTSGSRVAFSDGENDYIRLHRPHPRNILKPYQIEDIITALQERGLL